MSSYPHHDDDSGNGTRGWFRSGLSLSGLVQIIVVFAGLVGFGYVLSYRMENVERQQESLNRRVAALEVEVARLSEQMRSLHDWLVEKQVLRGRDRKPAPKLPSENEDR